MAIKVALVDDHVLLRTGLATLIKGFPNYIVHIEASNGKDFIEQLDINFLPDIVLMDISMPEMDGYQTTAWLKERHPSVKVLALTMIDNESAIIRMLRCGAKGYLLKDSDPAELKMGIDTVAKQGIYLNELVSNKIMYSISTPEDAANEYGSVLKLKDKEIQFLKLCCTELNYREIAEEMNYSHRTIDGFRDALFEKLHVKTRAGLVMYAIKNGIVTV